MYIYIYICSRSAFVRDYLLQTYIIYYSIKPANIPLIMEAVHLPTVMRSLIENKG